MIFPGKDYWATALLTVLCSVPPAVLSAQRTDTLQTVTVTAEQASLFKTDNVITLLQMAMPSTVIDAKTISLMGSRRLDEVMREQTGVAVVSDLGSGNRAVGLQMQGFSAEYITVLLDGQPIAGRNNGNLDLSRFSISNIERIEITKGASSSLYGSEALGGVVNIITRQYVNQPQLTIKTTLGTYHTAEAAADAETPLGGKKGALFMSGNYYKTGGFNVNPYLQEGQTAPPYNSLSLSARARYHLTPVTNIHLTARYAGRTSVMNRDYGAMPSSDQLKEYDFNGMAALESRMGQQLRVIGRYYVTRYSSLQQVSLLADNHSLQREDYLEYVHRMEWQLACGKPSGPLSLIGGAGAEYQTARSAADSLKGNMYNYFVYAQSSYTPWSTLKLMAGARYDGNSIYGGKVNPSAGVHYSPFSWLQLQAAVGMGYKSPTYRQLYQVFTNITQGYTVAGANVFDASVKALQAAGIVQQLWPEAALVKPLKAETSVSYNAGFALSPLPHTRITLNAFYNDIKNLINTQQVGIKSNGAQLFSYINIASAYTKGLEAGFSIELLKKLTLNGGYQLLYAIDRTVLDSIRSGAARYSTVRSYPSPRASVTSDYFGLPNRSRHMATLQLFYELPALGIRCSVRGNYRSKYGFLDTDNNGFIDPFDVYVKGYTLFNASVQKLLCKNRLTLQLTMDNIGNYTDYLMPAQPGRMLLAGVSWKCFTEKNTQP